MGTSQETLEISEQTEALGSAMVRDGLLEEEVPPDLSGWPSGIPFATQLTLSFHTDHM